LSSGLFIPRNREILFTYNIDYNYNFDKEIINQRAEMFLKKLSGADAGIRKQLLTALGIAMSTFVRTKEVTFFIGNENSNANNGKSVWFEVVAKIVGRLNVSIKSLKQICGNTFATSALRGKIINLADDIENEFTPAAIIKTLSGSMYFDSEEKYVSTIETWIADCNISIEQFCGEIVPFNNSTKYWFDAYYNWCTDNKIEKKFIVSMNNFKTGVINSVKGLSACKGREKTSFVRIAK
jgi:phage/plasmid-associated DNA primase